MKLASYNVLKKTNVLNLLKYLDENSIPDLETFNEKRNAIIVKKIEFMMKNDYIITLQEVDKDLLALLIPLIIPGYNYFNLGSLVIIGKNLTKIDNDNLLICESDNYTVMTYLSNGDALDIDVVKKVNEIKNEKPTFFTSNMKGSTEIELKLLNDNSVQTSYTSDGFGNTDGIWGPDNFFVKEDNTDFPHYNGNKQNHYDIEELIKDKSVDDSKTILMKYNFPGPNLMTQPSDHLCVKLEIEEIDTTRVVLELGSYESRDSTKKIGSYNMSFASISDLVKYNSGHFSSEAVFLAKNKSDKKYIDNAKQLLDDFMSQKPLAVGLQEMLQYKFQDLKLNTVPFPIKINNIDTTNKVTPTDNGFTMSVQTESFPPENLTSTKIVFGDDFITFSDATDTINNDFLTKIKDSYTDYNLVVGTVFAENGNGESAVILSHKSLGKIINKQIYNTGIVKNKQLNDSRPCLIAHTQNYLLICVHAANDPTKYQNIVLPRIQRSIDHYIENHMKGVNVKDVYIMGDFNDAYNTLKEFNMNINKKPFTPKYKDAPTSCCYNWNSAGFNPKQIPPKDADVTIRRKEFLFENEEFYLNLLPRILKGDELNKFTFLKTVGSNGYLFGMPLMREQGNLLNYLFTGDYCFSNNNNNSVKIYRKIDHLDKFFEYPKEIQNYEKFNFLLYVYQSDPELRKKIYYLCSIESTESDHEMVYLDVDLTADEIIRQHVEAGKQARNQAEKQDENSAKGKGTSFGGSKKYSYKLMRKKTGRKTGRIRKTRTRLRKTRTRIRKTRRIRGGGN